MDRRTFVLGSLAGCSAFPPDRQYPAEHYKPQLLFEWTWRPDDGELDVDKDAGRVNRIVEHRVVTKEVYVTGTDENGTGYGLSTEDEPHTDKPPAEAKGPGR